MVSSSTGDGKIVNATHPSLINASLSNMSLHIVKFLVTPGAMRQNRNGLRDGELRGLLSHLYRNC